MTDNDVFGKSYSYFTVNGDNFDEEDGESEVEVFSEGDGPSTKISFKDEADEASESGGGRRKDTFVVGDKSKAHRSLERRDTFTLEELPGPIRAKSSGYGIESIIKRAETLGPLGIPVREYLASHFRMMGEENNRILKEGRALQLKKQKIYGMVINMIFY